YANEDIQWGDNWSRVPPSTHHLPAYAFLIRLVRVCTFGWLPTYAAAHIIAFLTWLGAIRCTAESIELLCPSLQRAGILSFALFPFVGLSDVVLATGDPLGLYVLSAAVLFLLRRSWLQFCAVTAAGLLVHKILWPFFALLSLVAVFKHGYRPSLLILS